MGKLPNKELTKLLDCIKKDSRVIVPPMLGYDAGVHLIGDKSVVVATDPCIGVPEEWFGWLLIHYAASDVAVFGAKPEFCTITLLGSLATKPEAFQSAMKQICQATGELDLAIVRGHTGSYDGITKPVGVCTVYGTVEKEKLRTPRNIKERDLILCTKSIGHETLTNFCLTHKEFAKTLFDTSVVNELSKMVILQTCVWEALRLTQISGVHAMHDATEGGIVAALNELAEASSFGFTINWEKLPISRETRVLQDYFKLSDEQILSMSSTGTLLAAVEPKAQEIVEAELNKMGVASSFIGQFTKDKKRILIKNGKKSRFPITANDPYAYLFSRNS